MKSLRVLFALFALALAGCVETRFESPLGDNIETCDAGWKGLWVGSDADRSDASAFYVDDECRFVVVDQPDKNRAPRQVHVPVNFVHADGKDFIVVADRAIKDLVDIKPPHGVTPTPDKSFFYARYRVRGDRIDLYQVDSKHTAKLVLDGKLAGTIDKTDNELHVYVRGTRAEMLAMIRSEHIFEEKNSLILLRKHQTLDEFEKSVIPAASAKGTP